MLIHQLFDGDRDPSRHLTEVVNAEDKIDVRSEIDEYVFTEHTLSYLRQLLDGILETAQGTQPDCLRTWISGFFGSGKSHFLKLSATLLSNQELELPTGGKMPALEYATKKHKLDLPIALFSRDFRVRAVTVNLATAMGGGKQAQETPLLYRLLSEIWRQNGYSALPHIASLEREIQKAKKWDALLKVVRELNEGEMSLKDAAGRPLEWTDPEVRDTATNAHDLLGRALPEIKFRYSNAKAVRDVLRDGEVRAPTHEDVVLQALAVAEKLDPNLGRVLLCVDEVALYLTGNRDRVREIQGLAEMVRSKGKGKVLLWVTAQQRVDTIDAGFTSDTKVIFLRDRFPERMALEERDIDQVVRERWLKKDKESAAYAKLVKDLAVHGGTLARAAKLHDENLVRDTEPLTSPEAVLAYYPCLPYHVRLLQAILEALRGPKQIDQTAAQSRALLTTVRSLFVQQNGGNLATAELGALVTFDRVYDVIRDVVRKTDSTTDQWITGLIANSMDAGREVKISSVAKVIFLLQHLNPAGNRRIRVDAENVAALLYPRLGAAWDPHLAAVRAACEVLKDEHFIGEEPETGYRFYRQEEKTFQGDVDRQPVDEPAFFDLLRKAIDAAAKAQGMGQAVHESYKLPVEIRVHAGDSNLPDPDRDAAGLELHLLWPKVGETVAVRARQLAARYAGAPHVVLWYLSGDSTVDQLVRRVLKLDGAIRDYTQRVGSHAQDLLRKEQARLNSLRDVELPRAIEQAISAGIVIHEGLETPIGGKRSTDVFREIIHQAVSKVFTQIDIGLAQIDEVGLKKVFSWKPPAAPPSFFTKLKLFDADGNPALDRAFLREIMLALRGRPEKERLGLALLEHFARVPYGWPERAVKAGLGALLRGRRLTATLQDRTVLRTPADSKAESWLIGAQLFNKSTLELSEVNLTPAEREALTRLFAEAFAQPGADTVEKLEALAKTELAEILSRARQAHADLHGRQLPGAAGMHALLELLEESVKPELPAGRLKQLLTEAAKLAQVGEPREKAMRPMLDRLRLVEQLRAKNRLDRLATACRRAASLYTPWQAEGGGADVKSEWALLKEQVAGESLLSGATEALARDQKCFTAYARDYEARHRERHEKVSAAISELHAHPGWAALPPDEQRRTETPLAALHCDAAAELSADHSGDGLCPSCHATYGKLQLDAEVADTRLQAALRKLNLLTSPPSVSAPASADAQPDGKTERREATRPTPAITMDIRTASDLPKLYEQIGQAVGAALAGTGMVRVTCQVSPASKAEGAGERN